MNLLDSILQNQSLVFIDAPSGTTYTAVDTPTSESLSGGLDGTASTDGELKASYEKFNDADTVDVGLIIAGPSGSASHIDNLITIAENRKDCVVFASPQRCDVVNISNSNNVSLKNCGLLIFSFLANSKYGT